MRTRKQGLRDEDGNLGMLDRDCPHRNADLAFGRLEDGGLRCPFHGWLFDVKGRCLQTPAEPKGSTLCKRIQQKSYPGAPCSIRTRSWFSVSAHSDGLT